MARVYYEDIYNLGLLYAYIDSNGVQKMVLLDDLKKFYNTVEKNLEEMNIDANDIYAGIWNSNDEPIYFVSSNKEGDVYYVLKPEFNLLMAKRKYREYIGCLSSEVIEASLKENALECIEPVMKQEIKNNNHNEKTLCLGSKITFEK